MRVRPKQELETPRRLIEELGPAAAAQQQAAHQGYLADLTASQFPCLSCPGPPHGCLPSRLAKQEHPWVFLHWQTSFALLANIAQRLHAHILGCPCPCEAQQAWNPRGFAR